MKNKEKIFKYTQLSTFIDGLFNSKPTLESITIYANLVTLIKTSFKKVSWVGFYLMDQNKKGLILGPFSGPLACNYISLDNGVCGKCATLKETQIVDDVNKIPYHIACDSQSKSEIVLPLIINNQLVSVLDLDSHELNTFDEIDKQYLEEILLKVKQYIEKNKA